MENHILSVLLQQEMPAWMMIVTGLSSAIGLSGLGAVLVKAWADNKSEKEKSDRHIKEEDHKTGNQVLLDTIEDMRKDMSEQKKVEVTLRDQLANERADKVRYRTKLEMMVNELQKQVDHE